MTLPTGLPHHEMGSARPVEGSPPPETPAFMNRREPCMIVTKEPTHEEATLFRGWEFRYILHREIPALLLYKEGWMVRYKATNFTFVQSPPFLKSILYGHETVDYDHEMFDVCCLTWISTGEVNYMPDSLAPGSPTIKDPGDLKPWAEVLSFLDVANLSESSVSLVRKNEWIKEKALEMRWRELIQSRLEELNENKNIDDPLDAEEGNEDAIMGDPFDAEEATENENMVDPLGASQRERRSSAMSIESQYFQSDDSEEKEKSGRAKRRKVGDDGMWLSTDMW